MTVTELPDLVPARMLNEYVYCPRLFFLEWWIHCGPRTPMLPKRIVGIGGWTRAAGGVEPTGDLFERTMRS